MPLHASLFPSNYACSSQVCPFRTLLTTFNSSLEPPPTVVPSLSSFCLPSPLPYPDAHLDPSLPRSTLSPPHPSLLLLPTLPLRPTLPPLLVFLHLCTLPTTPPNSANSPPLSPLSHPPYHSAQIFHLPTPPYTHLCTRHRSPSFVIHHASPTHQEEMLRSDGMLLLGQLLRSISSVHFSDSVVHALAQLAETTLQHALLHRELLDKVVLRFDVWRRLEPALQSSVLALINALASSDEEAAKAVQLPQRLLDAARK